MNPLMKNLNQIQPPKQNKFTMELKKDPICFKAVILELGDTTCRTEAWKSQFRMKSDTIHTEKCHNEISLLCT